MKKYENKIVIPPPFIAVAFWIIFFTGCSTVLSTFSEEIVLGHFSDIKNGRLLIPVELEKKINSWYIIFGESQYPDKMRKLGDKLLNQALKVSIVNRTNIEVKFRGEDGSIRILPNKEKLFFSGTLLDLIFTAGAIFTSHYYGDQPCKFDIKLEFDNKDIKINTPIKIRAYRHWK